MSKYQRQKKADKQLVDHVEQASDKELDNWLKRHKGDDPDRMTYAERRAAEIAKSPDRKAKKAERSQKKADRRTIAAQNAAAKKQKTAAKKQKKATKKAETERKKVARQAKKKR